jgi:hypothetical protein
MISKSLFSRIWSWKRVTPLSWKKPFSFIDHQIPNSVVASTFLSQKAAMECFRLDQTPSLGRDSWRGSSLPYDPVPQILIHGFGGVTSLWKRTTKVLFFLDSKRYFGHWLSAGERQGMKFSWNGLQNVTKCCSLYFLIFCLLDLKGMHSHFLTTDLNVSTHLI